MKRSTSLFICGVICVAICTSCASDRLKSTQYLERQIPSQEERDTQGSNQGKEPMGIFGLTGLIFKSIAMGFVTSARETVINATHDLKQTSEGSVLCDRTPAQGMSPLAPGMCNDPFSGGQISRKYLEEHPQYAKKLLIKAKSDALHTEEESNRRKQSLATQEAERKRQEQGRAAYWTLQEQISRDTRVRDENERLENIAAQEVERNRKEKARVAYWAQQEQISRDARARDDAERQRNMAAQDVECNRQEQSRVEYWDRQEKESAAARAQDEVTRQSNIAAQEEVRRQQQQASKDSWSKKESDYSEAQARNAAIANTPTQNNASTAPVTTGAPYIAPPIEINSEVRARNTVNTNHAYAQVLSPQEIAWINALPPGDATRTLTPATIARMKREGKWGTYVAGTNSANKSIATDLRDQKRIEQRVITGLEVAKTAGEASQVWLNLTPAGKVTGTIERVAAKRAERIAEKKAAKVVSSRAGNAASTSGISKTLPIRRTSRQSEIDVGETLPPNARPQVSYKNGKEVPYGTADSVRLDWCVGTRYCVEVKNYNIAKNSSSLVSKVAEQALQRKQHMPHGITQEVVIDVRGQMVTPQKEFAIIKAIIQKTNGVIRSQDVTFIR